MLQYRNNSCRMPSRLQSCLRLRGTGGAAIIEGVIALSLIIAGAIGASILVANVGMTAYYKEKLGMLASSAAACAVGSSMFDNSFKTANPSPYSGVVQEVNDSLTAMGLPTLPPSKIIVTPTPAGDGISVTIDHDKLPLMLGGIGNIHLKETASVPLNYNQPPGLLTLTDMASKNSVIVPCYGKQLSWGSNLGPSFVWGRSSPAPGAPPGTAQLHDFSYYSSFYFSFNNPGGASTAYSESIGRGDPSNPDSSLQ